MTAPVFENVLWDQFELTIQLTTEAREYFDASSDDEETIRYLMRFFLVPAYTSSPPRVQAHVRRSLLWFIHCAPDAERWGVIGQNIDAWPGQAPATPRTFFEWWWAELFGDERPIPGDICKAEYVRGYPPDWENGDSYPDAQLDPAVVNFPRRDGNPPGHGAPEHLRVQDPPPPVLRPTDASRFLRWEDQANALDRAQEIEAQTGQHKVWLEFPHVIGEGYLIGGQEYRETNVACVRFRNGLPVDSWPDLRRGWTP